jgi:hypothetical protein
MSIVEDISVGGVKFIAPSDLKLKDKIVQLLIKIPELAPLILELEAMVVNVKQNVKLGFNTKYSEVRVKFINLSEANKEHLSVVERMIDLQESKNTSKADQKKI